MFGNEGVPPLAPVSPPLFLARLRFSPEAKSRRRGRMRVRSFEEELEGRVLTGEECHHHSRASLSHVTRCVLYKNRRSKMILSC